MRSESRALVRERSALVACLVLGGGLLVASLQYPLTVEGRVGPGTYPLSVAAVMIIASAMSLVRPRQADAAGDRYDDEPSDRSLGDAAWRVPAVVVVLVAYLALVQRVGHMITSCLLALVFLRIVSTRPWWQQVLIALALGIGTAELFARLGVPLPLGELLS